MDYNRVSLSSLVKKYKNRPFKVTLDSFLEMFPEGITNEELGEIYLHAALFLEVGESPGRLMKRVDIHRVGLQYSALVRETKKRFQEQCRLYFSRLIGRKSVEKEKFSRKELMTFSNPMPSARGREYHPETIEYLIDKAAREDYASLTLEQIGRAVRQGAENFYEKHLLSNRAVPIAEEYDLIFGALKGDE